MELQRSWWNTVFLKNSQMSGPNISSVFEYIQVFFWNTFLPSWMSKVILTALFDIRKYSTWVQLVTGKNDATSTKWLKEVIGGNGCPMWQDCCGPLTCTSVVIPTKRPTKRHTMPSQVRCCMAKRACTGLGCSWQPQWPLAPGTHTMLLVQIRARWVSYAQSQWTHMFVSVFCPFNHTM